LLRDTSKVYNENKLSRDNEAHIGNFLTKFIIETLGNMGLQGQEILLASTLAGVYATLGSVFGKGWVKRMVHHQPVVALSLGFAGLGLLMPVTVVPLRRGLGMPTNQYDAFKMGTDEYKSPVMK